MESFGGINSSGWHLYVYVHTELECCTNVRYDSNDEYYNQCTNTTNVHTAWTILSE